MQPLENIRRPPSALARCAGQYSAHRGRRVFASQQQHVWATRDTFAYILRHARRRGIYRELIKLQLLS
eukprot:3156050-Pleurochrysis_carterae.AAC.1